MEKYELEIPNGKGGKKIVKIEARNMAEAQKKLLDLIPKKIYVNEKKVPEVKEEKKVEEVKEVKPQKKSSTETILSKLDKVEENQKLILEKLDKLLKPDEKKENL